jgi:TP901 family phage tail tape measure protein
MANDKKVKRGIYLYIDGVGVGKDIKTIRAEMSKLVNEQAKMSIGSEEYIRHARKIAQLQGILQEHRDYQKDITKEYTAMGGEANKAFDNMGNGAKKSTSALGSLADKFNRFGGMAATAAATITGVVLAMRKAVDQFAELEEAEADVIKYTGSTSAEVKELGEDFKKFDTRTSRVELLKLAADAGRLGKTSKKDLLEFAEAGNIIRVSLGSDLGEDAIKNIGKLSMMFGDADRLGLKEAMLATGSAINEVAQNSSASEPYLVEFTNRLAGVGNQAGMSISHLVGLASVLDQNGQQTETAATALSNLIQKMFQDPAKFAAIAGVEVKSFTELLRKDANEALLTLLTTLGSKGGMAELAPIFEDMKIEGARASGIISVLAGNIGQVRIEQERAATAFASGKSVVNEYNVKNNTLQASLEKAKKRFQEIVYELGERLAPHMAKCVSAGGMMVKVISEIVSFVIEHGHQLLILTSVVIAYATALNALTILEKARNIGKAISLMVTQTKEWYAMGRALGFATANQLMFNKALLTNPYVLIATAVTGIVTALVLYVKRAKEAITETAALADVNKSAAQSIARERAEVASLLSIAQNEKKSKEERLKAIKELNKIAPEYLGNLSLENINTDTAKKAVEDYTAAILANAKAKVVQQKIEEQYAQIIEVELKLEAKKKRADKIRADVKNGKRKEAVFLTNLNADIKELTEEKAAYEKVIATYTNLFSLKKTPPPPQTLPPQDTGGGGGSGEPDEKELKKQLDAAEKVLENTYKLRTAAAKKEYIERQITEEELQDRLLREESTYLYARLELYQKFGQDTGEIENTIADKTLRRIADMKAEETKKKKPAAPKQEEEEEGNMDFINELAKGVEVQMAMNEALYANGLIIHEEYLYKKAQLEERYRQEQEQKDQASAQKKIAMAEGITNAISSITGSAATFVKTAQAREEAAIEKKYKTQLILAEGNNEMTAALEEQKEADLLAVRKKYADKAFALQVLGIVAETAVAAMRAYSSALAIPYAGLALAPIMAAAAVAAGAAQIAIANQQREQAANMWEGGYTGAGGKYEKKRLIQTHGGEFVANKKTVETLRPVFDLMDYAQRTGNVAALTSPEMAAAVGGATAGGVVPVSVPSGVNSGNTAGGEVAAKEMIRLLNKLSSRLDEPITAEASIAGPKGVKKQLDKYEKLIRNASR